MMHLKLLEKQEETKLQTSRQREIIKIWAKQKIYTKNQQNKKYFLQKRLTRLTISFFIIIHLFTCAYIVWVISPPLLPAPTRPFSPPLLPGRTCSAPISNFVGEDVSIIRKTKRFC
jgi:hypothetical protein